MDLKLAWETGRCAAVFCSQPLKKIKVLRPSLAKVQCTNVYYSFGQNTGVTTVTQYYLLYQHINGESFSWKVCLIVFVFFTCSFFKELKKNGIDLDIYVNWFFLVPINL